MSTQEVKNPYTEMTPDVLTKHLEQLSSHVKEKKVDVTQYFGTPISQEDQDKLGTVDSLNTKVKELNEAASAKDLSDNEKILAEASIARVVSDIRKIDKDAPLGAVLESKFNNLDKLAILSSVQGMVEHYTGQLTTIKKELGTKSSGTSSTDQSFGKPNTGDKTAAEIIAEMNPKSKQE